MLPASVRARPAAGLRVGLRLRASVGRAAWIPSHICRVCSGLGPRPRRYASAGPASLSHKSPSSPSRTQGLGHGNRPGTVTHWQTRPVKVTDSRGRTAMSANKDQPRSPQPIHWTTAVGRRPPAEQDSKARLGGPDDTW